MSAPPIGCVPSQRTLGGGMQRKCAEKCNEAAKLFNDKLSSKVDSLNSNLPNSKMVYLDVYYPLLDLIENPAKYGKISLFKYFIFYYFIKCFNLFLIIIFICLIQALSLGIKGAVGQGI